MKDKEGRPQKFDQELAQTIFSTIDVNGDGLVTLDEYLGAYVDIVERLNDSLSDMCKKLIEHKRQRDENLEKLDIARVST